jgi:hypothetical protein
MTDDTDEALGFVRVETWEGKPTAWMANTGTAGTGEGCDRPFWLRHEAVAYVVKHGGYIRPLFTIRALENSIWKP